jgi:TM2 domain-containing membrane protein YozV
MQTVEMETKSCPFCAEPIKKAAVRCKHCQADLSKVPDPGAEPPAPAIGEDFEQRFLAFAYQTNVPLNVPAVAYALKVSTAVAAEHLEEMAARDILVRDVDDEGNVFFTIPGRRQPFAQSPLIRTSSNEMVPASPPSEGVAVAALVLNLMFPGVGSLVAGRTQLGVAQLVMFGIGLPLSFILIGFPLVVASWVWSLMTGIRLIDESRRL